MIYFEKHFTRCVPIVSLQNCIRMRCLFKAVILFSGIVLFAGCRGSITDNTGIDAIQMPISCSARPFADCVLSVELVPLETDEIHLLGNNVDLCLLNDSYVLYDKRNAKVYRYSFDGHFLNEIGKRGNGPGEYLNLRNVQVFDGEIHIFSQPDKELVFSPGGELLEHRSGVPVGFGIHRVESGLLTYYGFSGQRNHRIVFTKGENGPESGFLELVAKVMTLDLENELFCDLPEGDVSILDSYSPTVYRYDGKEVLPYLTFDFGKYSIKKAFYEAGDAFKSAEYLMSSDYAVINRFMEGNRHKLVQVNMFDQRAGAGGGRYGLYDGERWLWFSLSEYKLADSIPFRCFDEDILIGLFSPEDIKLLCRAMPEKVAESGMLASLDENDNYVIAKVCLR